MHRHSAMWEYKHVYIYLLASVQRKSFLQCLAFGQAEASINLLAQMSFQLDPKAFWRAELISQFFYYSNSSKNITCMFGKLKTEFTSLIAKSTNPGLSDTTFFARCWLIKKRNCQKNGKSKCWVIKRSSRNDSFEDKKWRGRMKVPIKAAKIVLKKARYKRRNSIRTLSQWLASPV